MSIIEKFSWLPVSAIASEVNASLEAVPRLVVTAPPGAGKSTLLPLSMLESLPEGKILMLEPRRIAARQVAARMAAMLGEQPGAAVGYRVRFESRVSPSTRIEVLTEGIMERMLVDDPTLDGVAAVIFDEFHERSLASDLALALTLEAQNVIRPDLRIMLMSATIDAGELCARLDAPHLHSPGRMFPVDIVHAPDGFDPRDCATVVARAVARAHGQSAEGNILAFLPGQAEIEKCARLLDGVLGSTEVLPLYGMLPPAMQQRVLVPPRPGDPRRVVLATSIAETSLTIEGVTAVIDSGLCRTMVFDPASGLSHLATVSVSLDMAAQRAGRAGRLGPGTCFRLWTKASEHLLKDSRQPEIATADLAHMLLSIAAWGESDPMRLPWLTPPAAGHVAHARRLLLDLGAIDGTGRITSAGSRMAALPCHPRIARMLDSAASAASAALACDIAALLDEKDPLSDSADSDITTRIALLRQYRSSRKLRGVWKRVADAAAQYRRLISCPAASADASFDPADAGALIALAFPERLALRAPDGRYRLASGSYTSLPDSDALSRYELLAAATVGSRIFMAAPISRDRAAALAKWHDAVYWDARTHCVRARAELRAGTLVLDTRPADTSDPATRDLILRTVCEAAPKYGLTMFDFNDRVRRMQLRIATVAAWHPEMQLPAVDTDCLLATCASWLPLYIGKATSAQELRKIDMAAVIWGLLPYAMQEAVERLAPDRFTLPCGRSVAIDYRVGAETPVVSARLQDCFGLMRTPCLDGGTRPVLMELLSPGFKPVQLTQDLEGFWANTYFEVRKELRRRYPRHRWPDNPANL